MLWLIALTSHSRTPKLRLCGLGSRPRGASATAQTERVEFIFFWLSDDKPDSQSASQQACAQVRVPHACVLLPAGPRLKRLC